MRMGKGDGPIPDCPSTRNASQLPEFTTRTACSASLCSERTNTCKAKRLGMMVVVISTVGRIASKLGSFRHLPQHRPSTFCASKGADADAFPQRKYLNLDQEQR